MLDQNVTRLSKRLRSPGVRLGFSLLLGSLLVGGVRTLPASEAVPDFSRDILPLLSENCFKCHGPDAGARKAKLRKVPR